MPNIFKHWKSVGICNGHFSLLGRKMKLYCSFLGRCQDITQKISKHLLTNIYIYIRKRRFPQLNLDILSQASKFIGGSHDFPSRSWYPHGTPNGYPSMRTWRQGMAPPTWIAAAFRMRNAATRSAFGHFGPAYHVAVIGVLIFIITISQS